MIKINLVSEGRRPVAVRKAREALGVGTLELGETLAIALAILGVLVVAGYWWYLRSEVNERQRAITAAQKEVEELKPVLKEVEDFKKKKAELEHKIQVINQLKENQWGPVRIMDLISAGLPELLWLDQMSLRSNHVELRGRAFNTNQVATFIENLGKVPEFQEPRLRDTNRRGQIYNFVITFNFKPVMPQAAAPQEAEAAAAGG
ncbi:MAG TPA: PilN domain-containing protein [Thermoanaerobaculia bacterium]|nr:PilN domain-containing protein [Thermoanaerobaculia bacterium]